MQGIAFRHNESVAELVEQDGIACATGKVGIKAINIKAEANGALLAQGTDIRGLYTPA